MKEHNQLHLADLLGEAMNAAFEHGKAFQRYEDAKIEAEIAQEDATTAIDNIFAFINRNKKAEGVVH